MTSYCLDKLCTCSVHRCQANTPRGVCQSSVLCPLSCSPVVRCPVVVLPSARADHPFRSAAFCSSRFRRCGSALACFALPRRDRSTARPALGRHHECVGDLFLGRSLSLLHLPNFLLARADFAIRPRRDGRWSGARIARFGIDPMGKSPAWAFLHTEPVASPSRHDGNRSTSCLRLVARHTPQRCRRSTLVFIGDRHPTFYRGRSRLNRVLSSLRYRSARSNRAPRKIAHKMNRERSATLTA